MIMQHSAFQSQIMNAILIILIGAQNGHGKTTLLEAVYLCLYDKDAVSHLQRAGLNASKKNYADFLQSALYHQAQMKYGQYNIELEVEICRKDQTDELKFRIKRKWYFDSGRRLKLHDSDVMIEVAKNGIYQPIPTDFIGQYFTIRLPYLLIMLPFSFLTVKKSYKLRNKVEQGYGLIQH